MENTRANSEVDGFSRSLLEEGAQQEIQLPGSGLKSHDLSNILSLSLGEIGNEAEEQVPQPRSSWPTSTLPSASSGGTIESINLDAVPQLMSRLDNTAARHKLSVKPRNQRVSKKHGKLALEMQNVTVHEFEYELEEKVPTRVENGQKHHKTVDAKNKEEKRHHKDEDQRYREEVKKHKLQEKDQTQYKFSEQKRLEDAQGQEAQRMQDQGQRSRQVEEQKFQEEEQRREVEEHKLREEKLRREVEEQKVRDEEQRWREVEEQKVREEERRQREVEEQKVREEEQRQREMEEQNILEKEQRQRELEEQNIREEEQRQRELEEQKVQEEEQRRREVEEQNVREEEQRQREVEEQKVQEQRRREVEEKNVQEEEQRRREVEEQNVQEQEQRRDIKKQKLHEEEQGLCEEEKQNRELVRQCQEIVDLKMEKAKERCLETEEMNQRQEKEKLQFSAAENKQSNEETHRKDLEIQKQQKVKRQPDLETPQREDEERLNDSKVLNQEQQQFLEAQEEEQRREELRWKELDQRQTMSQPFSFQVASGEKQIIFPKVNLTPVTHPRETAPSLDTNVLQSSPKLSKGLSSSSYVPHTAILVTGAQLCGTAVDLKQIKDTACKSLLGFSGEKKAVDLPFIERTSNSNPDMRSRIGKSKFSPGQSLDQSRALTEWATIRAKILKSSNERLQEKERRVHGRFSDDWTTFKVSSVHGSLRKTLSANAKFSITPAWQKWADGNKVNDGDKVNIFHEKEKQNTPAENVPVANSTMDSSEPSRSLTSGDIAQDVTKDIKDASQTENHNIRIADAAEGCKFAKDLPSFLVPSLPATPRKEHSLPQAQLPFGNRAATNVISQTEGTMDTSPFGIKLRRTHYSLRFHYEQQGEQKRKKRYSAGDSMEGIPAFLAANEKEGESCTVSDHKNTKTSLDSDVREEDEKNGTSVQTYRLKNEEETKDKKSLFPSINLPWRERADKKPDSIKKEKPILQSRHSLDSSRLVDKVESAQPLWITLAMQKQKGFREQQASREERRQAREAKIAEKLTKENITVSSSMDIKGGSYYPSTLKKSTQDEEKKIGTTIVSKVERREHLKKSSTLPNSVTVEICDSVASIPPVKELPKKFSTPDAAPVSVEPAWLALAKRKAKAWSDCPQIIK